MLKLLPFALGYAYSYLLRSAGAPLAAPMARDLGLSPSASGVLNALFFLAFAAAQVPLGHVLERWGPSRTLAALLALAALGCGLVAAAPGLALLALGRLAMGAGVALALVGALRAYQLLAPGRLGFLTGLTVALGGLGGLLSTWPLVRLGEAWGWRGVYGALGVLALGLALWIRGVPTAGTPRKAGAGGALALPVLLPLALVSGAYVGGFFALQSFWVGAYAYAQGFSGDEVGGLLALLNLASVLGAFASGGLAAAWGTGRALAVGVGVFALGLLAWGIQANLALAYALLGLGGGFNGLVLAHTATLFPEASSRAMAWVNLAGVVGIFALQAGMGPLVEGLGYRGALLVLFALQAAALALLLLWRSR